MLYTSRFSNPELKTGNYTTVRISLGAPKWPLGYEINGEINDLKPYGLLNIQDRDEYEQKYLEKLERIGVSRINRQIESFGEEKPVVLLCYEDVRDPSQWCHRTMFAKWWLEKTGEIAEELQDPTQPKLKKTAQNAENATKAQRTQQVSSKSESLIRRREAEQMQISIFDSLVW